MRSKPRLFRIGDFVSLRGIPDGLTGEARKIFSFCLGLDKEFQVIGKQGKLLVLDVSQDVDPVFGGFMNDIRVEPKHLWPVGPR